MRDPRLDKLAGVLVGYSTRVEPGQLVRLSGDPLGLPLLEALYEAVLKAGGHPVLRCSPESARELMFRLGSEEQVRYVSPLALEEVKTIDATIGLWAEHNTKALSGVAPRRQSLASAARRPVMEVFFDRAARGELKWCGTQYPTAASAQDAEMSLTEYEDFVFEAGLMHLDDPIAAWTAVERKQQKLVDYLQGKKELRFRAPGGHGGGTDLRVNVEGMTWINCAGRENFPDGEVFTGPNLKAPDGGVNGTVGYTFPAVHHGREVHDITFTFERGKVVDFEASKGAKFLEAMLDQDEGARFMGEIAIGTNYAITRYTRNTLFDEKIGGTFHAAVGAGYPETGNANASGLHWDMVCDLRSAEHGGEGAEAGGTIEADGEVFSRGGRFVFDGWPSPADPG